MAPDRVRVFFYGSYINENVLRSVDLSLTDVVVARLMGWELRIAPLANLVPSDRGLVYGVNSTATHAELRRLYRHAEEVLGGVYEPHPVIVEESGHRYVPALCYVSHTLLPAPAARDYVDRIVGPARALGFPDWYCAHIESFGRSG